MEPTDEELIEELNDAMTQAVLPVTTFVGIETVLGFLGNLLVIYVFSCRYHVCNFRYFVLCMAFLDLTSCLTTMPGEMLTQTHWYTYKWNHICKVKSFFNVFTVTGVAFCLLTIALDRYRKVCRPFGWQIKPKVAIVICLAIYVTAIVVSVPVAILWGVQTDEKVYKNRTITVSVCETDENFKGTSHPHNYTIGIYVILSISLFGMFVLYIFVARKLFRDKQKYYGPSSTISTFMNSTYLAGASSDVLDSSTKPDSSDTKPAHGNKNKKMIFNIEADTDYTTDDTTHESDKHEKDKNKRSPYHNKKTKKRAKKLRKRKHLDRREMAARVRRKTLIMFILTIVFILTTILYITLLSLIADGLLPTLTDKQRAVYFFFFRFYFINHVVNPVIYGILDPHFRQVLLTKFRFAKAKSTTTSGRHS